MGERPITSHPQTPPQPPRVHDAAIKEEGIPLLDSIHTPTNREGNAMLKGKNLLPRDATPSPTKSPVLLPTRADVGVSTFDTNLSPDLPLDSSIYRDSNNDEDVGVRSLRIPGDDDGNYLHEPDRMDLDNRDRPKSPTNDNAALVEFPHSSPTLEVEDEERLARIRAAIEYTRKQYASGSMPTVHTQFVTSRTDPLSVASAFLSRAAQNGLATVIWESPYSMTYALGSPPAPKMYGGMDAQWWARMSKAEMKAGPFAGAAAVKKAESLVKQAVKRKEKSEKTGRLKTQRKALDEGIRRRKLGLRMWDEEIEKPERGRRHEYSEDEELQQAGEPSGHGKRVRFTVDDSDQDFEP